MTKQKKSGSAVFMDIVIYICLMVAVVCFVLYYAHIVHHDAVLWVGITTFTILYHFEGRILMGLVTKRLPIRHSHPWFKERKFEMSLYKFLRIRKWKEKVLTYDPAAFSVENHTMEEIANTMSKAETDHWINELISLSTLIFGVIWGEFWIFLVTAVIAMLFDAQFIVVQRYNRPKVIRAMELQGQRNIAT